MRHLPSNATHRQALTLVELMVVIVILSLVTATTIPLMQPATGQRRIREASRLVAATLANAQARAITTGRPVGVWFERLPYAPPYDPMDPGDRQAQHSIEMFLCEVPPPYSGDSTSQVCYFDPAAGNNRVRFVDPLDASYKGIPKQYVSVGDLIRLRYRGPLLTILSVTPHPQDANSILYLTMEPTINPGAPVVQPMTYQIFRQPQKTADPPAQMPAGALVDLEYAGFSSGWLGALVAPQAPTDPKLSLLKPVLVMFGPSGSLESVYWGMKPSTATESDPGVLERRKPISSLFLLVGQPSGDAAAGQSQSNHLNFDHVWIAINSQSGLVTTSEVGSEFDVETGNYFNDTAAELDASRVFARSAQNMGGR